MNQLTKQGASIIASVLEEESRQIAVSKYETLQPALHTITARVIPISGRVKYLYECYTAT
jgi:hypothetical protein